MAGYRGKIEQRCPNCHWALNFASVDRSWVATCWNWECPVTVVPPIVNEPLLIFIRERKKVTSSEVSHHFGYSAPNAVNHLMRLFDLGLIKRRRIDPIKGGKRFEWSISTGMKQIEPQ